MYRYIVSNHSAIRNIFTNDKNHNIKTQTRCVFTKKHRYIFQPTVHDHVLSMRNNNIKMSLNTQKKAKSTKSKPFTENNMKLRHESSELTTLCVFGASGDLAKKKIFPALYALYMQNLLPENFLIYGFARTNMTLFEFREMIADTLTCRIDLNTNMDCEKGTNMFLEKCFYLSGEYDDRKSYTKLNILIHCIEKEFTVANRIFFYSIPSEVFISVAKHSMTIASSNKGYTRVIVEKPFGKDSESSKKLSEELLRYISEDQIYRIDHYLGKELIDNLLVLRFSNLLFEPLWSRKYIDNVQIIFAEPFGTEGRGGYFDEYNIIRDIMQNHLLQILTLFAMEPPLNLDMENIRDEKVKVLKSMRIPTLKDITVGQYKDSVCGSKKLPAYIDDPTVPNDSLCPTFAALVLFVDNPRWNGVPFLMKAGKALHKHSAEIRVQFHSVPAQLYKDHGLNEEQLKNELVINIQPDEAIHLKINNKMPGLKVSLDNSNLDLTYKTRYDKQLPDAYEILLLDVILGDKRLFVRGDELEAAWDIFTPVLHALEKEKIKPELYPYNSRGPIGSYYLASKHNVHWGDL